MVCAAFRRESLPGLGKGEPIMTSSVAPLPTPQGPGSVSGAPNLPEGFTGTFTSRYIDTGDLTCASSNILGRDSQAIQGLPLPSPGGCLERAK